MRSVLVGAGGFGREWWSCLVGADVEVVAVVDPDPEARTEAASFFGLSDAACHAADDTGWWTTDADFVVDCSPPSIRLTHARQAISAGKHLLVAKPMALTLRDAKRIDGLARQHRRALGVIQPFRYLPAFLQVREIVARGSLGRLGLVTINFNVDGTFWKPGWEWRRRMEHPLLLEGSVHVLDLIRWVTGDEPQRVVAQAFNLPWSEFVGASGLNVAVEMCSGAVIRYRANWSPRGSEVVPLTSGWELELEGGMVKVADESVVVNGKLQAHGPQSLGNLNAAVLEWFVDHMEGRATEGPSGGDNLRTMAFVEAVQRSADDGVRVTVGAAEAGGTGS